MWKAKVFISDHADMCQSHLSRVFRRLNVLPVYMIGLLGLLHIDEACFKQKLPYIDKVKSKQATGLKDKYLENFFAPFFFSFLFLEFSSDFVFNSDIMAKGGDFAASDLEQGERNIDFPMTIRPNQSVLVNELKSKFEAIDQRFDTLFERLNGNGNNLGNSSPKPVISNSESQIIYNQIWEVLEQWTGRHTQNYYELKHIFQLLNVFVKDQYQGD